jgi:hypothetical protein
MPPRNPLREDGEPREQLRGGEIINTRTQRLSRIIGPDGVVQDIVTDIHDSRPDENGNYLVTDVINVATDYAGNTFPKDPHSLEAISYSGLFIKSQDQRSECTSRLHPHNLSRIICLGHDGRLTANGAICARCDFWLTTIYLALTIVGVGVALGIYKVTGWF